MRHRSVLNLEKALRQAEITKSHYHIRPLLKKFLQFYNEEGQAEIIEKYIQRAVDICYKNPVELSKCYLVLYKWYATHAMKDIALKYYKYFLLATEENDLTHREILDQIWIDFILIDRSENFQFGPIGESLHLGSFEHISHQHLSSLHFKSAIIAWKCGALHEMIKMTNVAFDFYSEATKTFEKLIYNQWQFHLIIEQALSDFELCTILLDKILEICNDQIYSEENNKSFDIHSVICCFEFVSHWYFSKDRFSESLLFRQCQLELESKIFNVHPHAAWSLWFVGLIFQKTKEYTISLGYFNRAMNIFESCHSDEHDDIYQLQKHILQVKELISTENLSTVIERTENNHRLKSHKNQNVPQLLEMFVHID